MTATIDFNATDPYVNADILSHVVNNRKHRPFQLQNVLMFDEEGVDSTSVLIDVEGDVLQIFSDKPRTGDDNINAPEPTRDAIPVKVPHIPVVDSLSPAEIQNKRQSGSTEYLSETEALMKKTARWLANGDYTLEHHFMGALKGVVYDANGTRVLNDYLTLFGVSQQAGSFDFTSSKTTADLSELIRTKTETGLDGVGHNGIDVFCHPTFYLAARKKYDDRLTVIDSKSADLLVDMSETGFEVEGMRYWRYRGTSAVQIGQGSTTTPYAFAVPRVPGMFKLLNGPRNRNGMANVAPDDRYWMTITARPDMRGWNIWGEFNPLIINTRPGAVTKITGTIPSP